MPTVFGQALIDARNGQAPNLTMRMEEGASEPIDCTQFLSVRADEIRIIDQFDLRASCTVIDIGCGLGRHLAAVRNKFPDAKLYGEDICDALLNELRREFDDNCVFGHPDTDKRPSHIDLAMLLGNGLGVFGDQDSTIVALDDISERISSGGIIWIETGNPFGSGFSAPRFTIADGDEFDGPFSWGYASETWITGELSRRGFDVNTEVSMAPGNVFFHAIGTKR